MRFGNPRSSWLALWVILSMAGISRGQTVRAERVASQLSRPLGLVSPPGDSRRLFVVEQTGSIRILEPATGLLHGTPFLSVTDLLVSDEQGLLGLAFHPRFAQNGFFYVDFTRAGDGATVIRRYRVSGTDPDRADPAGLDLLVIPQPQPFHNGGWIGFGPADGYLYIAMGDGGAAYDTGPGHTEPGGNAQDLTDNLLGKLLRIDVDSDAFPADPQRNYAIPPNNPFVGISGDDEIWAYGLRNPWRCSFDAATSALYCGDVGESTREEIDYQPPGSHGGENYGWRLREGTIAAPNPVGGPAPGAINPILDYGRSGTIFGNVVTGGVVYRGPATALQGLYFFADFGTSHIWSFRFDGSAPAQFNGQNVLQFTDWNTKPDFLPTTGSIAGVAAFGSDAAGNVYFTNLYDGEVFALGIDSDGDGALDFRDRCPAFASSDQRDTDRNGIGDVCECGDQSGDGIVDVRDMVAVAQAIFDPSRVTPLCDANGDSLCNVSDIIAVNLRLFGVRARCSRNP